MKLVDCESIVGQIVHARISLTIFNDNVYYSEDLPLSVAIGFN